MIASGPATPLARRVGRSEGGTTGPRSDCDCPPAPPPSSLASDVQAAGDCASSCIVASMVFWKRASTSRAASWRSGMPAAPQHAPVRGYSGVIQEAGARTGSAEDGLA
jgi:hypothetical protein